jgi:hypothetical protein
VQVGDAGRTEVAVRLVSDAMSPTPDLLDPEVGAGLIVPFDDLGPDNLGELRGMVGFELPPSPGRSDHLVPGDPPVPVRVHRPAGLDGPAPCLYTMHGGGYVLGPTTSTASCWTTCAPAWASSG